MQPKTLSRNDTATLILLAAMLFGGLFRLMPAWLAGFPINDGGMFYTMILDLQANHYKLPAFTTYNNIAIPYAYPPLGFYLGAFFGDLFNISPILILQWLPGIINTLCILGVYGFANEIFDDKLKGAMAALFFAVIPHMSTWLSMGGGLTRSLGTLFMLATITCVYRAYRDGKPTGSTLLWVILYASLTIVSHTESAVFAVAISAYIWLWKSRTWGGVTSGALVILGVLAMTSLWLGTVLTRHGMEPFLSAIRTGGHSFDAVIKVINIDSMTGERYLDLLGVTGILGCILLLARNQYFIPGLLAMIYIAEPRSAHTIGNIPLALAGASLLTDVLTSMPMLRKSAVAVALPFILINSLYTGVSLANSHVSRDELSAMLWVDEHLPKDATFLVLNGETAGECDALTEWFPSLSKRTSVATMQGREWLIGERFVEFIARRDALQGCVQSDRQCLLDRSAYFDDAGYIFISRNRSCSSPANAGIQPPLIASLRTSEEFDLIHETEDVIIFAQNR